MNRKGRIHRVGVVLAVTWFAVIAWFESRSEDIDLGSEKLGEVANVISISADEPGVALGVFHNGLLVHASAYGMADLSHGVPFSLKTRSNLGSTSKQFTAFAILHLAAEGRLSLEDEVRRWIPELPEFGSVVTIRHLLTHTSGYREIYQTLKLTGRRVFEDHVDRREMIDVVRYQTGLQNAPGSKWDYNNTGYGLLSMIVERVTEQSFAAFLDHQVFAPLGMTNSVVRMNPSDPVRYSARGYQPDGDRFVETRDLGGAVGASGIYTTINDLAIWLSHFHSGTLESRLLVQRMTTPFRLNDGRSTGYGLGLYVDRWRGLKRIFHGGDDVAHRAITVYFPEIKGGVMVLSNNAGFDQYQCANRLAEIFFGDRLTEVKKAPGPSARELADFSRFAGRYEPRSNPGMVFTLRRDGDQLISEVAGDEYPLLPISRNRFRVQGQNARFEFDVDRTGEVKSAVLFHQGKQTLRRLLEGEQGGQRRDLSEFIGRYHSAELQTTYELGVEKERLVLTSRWFQQKLPLQSVQEDRFSGADPVSSVLFRRDEKGAVAGFRVGNGAGREFVWFERERP